MESSEKKKIIAVLVVMVLVMVGLSVFMRTGFQDIRKEKLGPAKQQQESSAAKPQSQPDTEENKGIKTITVEIKGTSFVMDVDGGKAGQEFAESTPFSLDMKDLNGNEKYFEGNEVLPTKPYKPGHIEVGDVMLYGDKTIVIFYKSFDTKESYTRLGKIWNADSLEYLMKEDEMKIDFYK